MVYISAIPRIAETIAHLDLSLDQLGVHLPIMYSGSNSDKDLSSLFGIFMRLSLRFRLNPYTLHHQRVKVKHGRCHDVFPCLKDEHDGDRAFGKDFWGVKSSGEWRVLRLLRCRSGGWRYGRVAGGCWRIRGWS